MMPSGASLARGPLRVNPPFSSVTLRVSEGRSGSAFTLRSNGSSAALRGNARLCIE